MSDSDEPVHVRKGSKRTPGTSHSAPALPDLHGSLDSDRESLCSPSVGETTERGGLSYRSRPSRPTSGKNRHSRPATVATSYCSSGASECRPGSGRFSPGEMVCFKKQYYPSDQCKGKAKVYFRKTGLVKQALAGVGDGNINCWHTLPVLKGHFFSNELLENPDAYVEPKFVKKLEQVLALPDEAGTQFVLDEIFPKTPHSKGFVPGQQDCFYDSPEKDRMQKGDAPGKKRDTSRKSGARRCAVSGMTANMSAMLGGTVRMEEPPSPSSAVNGSHGTKGLKPLVYFRDLLHAKYGSVQAGMNVWAHEFPSTNEMSKKEFKRLLDQKIGLKMDDDTVYQIFCRLDMDGGGSISMEEFQVSIDAAAPVTELRHLRRRWLAAGFKSMYTALWSMNSNDTAILTDKGLTLRELGAVLTRVHVTEPDEHAIIFSIIADQRPKVSLQELAVAVSTVSPHLIIEELRERLLDHYRVADDDSLNLRRAWTDLELGGAEIRVQDFIKQAVRLFELTPLEATNVFRAIDIDRNGFISREGFMRTMALSDPDLLLESLRRKIRQRIRSMRAVFENAFTNQENKGVVKRPLETFQELLLNVDLTASETETLFELIDVEDYGKLSFTDFLRGIYQLCPAFAFEDVRVQCLQCYGEIEDAFAAAAEEQVGLMDIAAFTQLLDSLQLAGDHDRQAMFDMLDINNVGTVSLTTLITMLTCGGPGAGKKIDNDNLRTRAKRDTQVYTGPVQRLVWDIKAETRDLRANGPAGFFKGSQEIQRPSTTVDPRTLKRGSSKYAPRLKRVENVGDMKRDVLHTKTLGPNELGPHSRNGDIEKTIGNPQDSWNSVWKRIQECKDLDPEDQEKMESSVQGYYQDVIWKLSSDVPLLEQHPSVHKLHQNLNIHRNFLESDAKRRVLGVKRYSVTSAIDATAKRSTSLPSLVTS